MRIYFFLSLFVIAAPAQAAVSIPITVTLSENVAVTGTPRIAVDVGGTTRYASYTSGTGTNALTFTLSPQAGDVDLDGVTVASPIDLNGGTIKDAKGNNATLTFTPPSTTNVKVNYPSLGMDFVYDSDGRYTLNGTAYNDLTSFLSASGGTFTRASIGTYFDSSGTMQTAATNTPRFDYDPGTLTARGILIEESRTNLAKYTSQFDTGWSKTNLSVSPNVMTAPDGSMTADKIVENTAAGISHVIFQNTGTGTLSSSYTVSAFLKAGERNKGAITFMGYTNWQGGTPEITFDLSTGSIVTTGTTTRSSIKDVGNGWYYLTFSSVMTTAAAVTPAFVVRDAGNNSTYTGDGSSGYYIWGVQVEAGAFPTSYIPTTSATVTRASDNLIIPTGSWFLASEGTTFASVDTGNITSGSQPAIFSFDDATINNRIQLRRNNSTNKLTHVLVSSGTTLSVAGGSTNWADTNAHKISFGYKSALNQSYFDGVSQTSYLTSSSMPNVTQLEIGMGTNATNINGHIGKIKYYPIRASNTQLQLLTQ